MLYSLWDHSLLHLPLTVLLPPESFVMRVTEADSDIRFWLNSMRQTCADSPSNTALSIRKRATCGNVWGGPVVAEMKGERV